MNEQGYVHVYTGNGKGKTTAALGLALRAAGAGWRVFFGQFFKGGGSSELAALERLSSSITVRQFNQANSAVLNRQRDDPRSSIYDLTECRAAAASGRYKLVVLDEVTLAVTYGLISVQDLIELIESKHESVELVITGRWAHRRVVERADLVTEMQEIKHYYQQGVLARTGIET